MAGTITGVRVRHRLRPPRLNGVRPRWPEQFYDVNSLYPWVMSLNGVRPRWPEQSYAPWRERSSRAESLNGVRPRWPEQYYGTAEGIRAAIGVSMESGLDGRNNPRVAVLA